MPFLPPNQQRQSTEGTVPVLDQTMIMHLDSNCHQKPETNLTVLFNASSSAVLDKGIKQDAIYAVVDSNCLDIKE